MRILRLKYVSELSCITTNTTRFQFVLPSNEIDCLEGKEEPPLTHTLHANGPFPLISLLPMSRISREYSAYSSFYQFYCCTVLNLRIPFGKSPLKATVKGHLHRNSGTQRATEKYNLSNRQIVTSIWSSILLAINPPPPKSRQRCSLEKKAVKYSSLYLSEHSAFCKFAIT